MTSHILTCILDTAVPAERTLRGSAPETLRSYIKSPQHEIRQIRRVKYISDRLRFLGVVVLCSPCNFTSKRIVGHGIGTSLSMSVAPSLRVCSIGTSYLCVSARGLLLLLADRVSEQSVCTVKTHPT